MRKSTWTRGDAAWVLLLLAAGPGTAAQGVAGTAAAYARIDVAGAGAARLAALQEMPGSVWWVELDGARWPGALRPSRSEWNQRTDPKVRGGNNGEAAAELLASTISKSTPSEGAP